MPIPQHKKYTAEEFFIVTPKESTAEQYELLDGEIVALASPKTIHQKLVRELSFAIHSYIKSNRGSCEVMISPYDVKLDDYNVVIPDVSVICDPTKIDDRRCNGSPDWIIEVTSSNRRDDYVRKLSLYEKFGVREYWIVDPDEQRTIVYFFENKKVIYFYDFNMTIPVNIYADKPIKLEINIANLLK
jgi:Uma2 family endonuclease